MDPEGAGHWKFGNTCVTRPFAARPTRPDPYYGFSSAEVRGPLVFPCPACEGAGTLCGSSVSAGMAVETWPGGGEPSAVKLLFCSASVGGLGSGDAVGFFMARLFPMTLKAPCMPTAGRCLSLSAHARTEGTRCDRASVIKGARAHRQTAPSNIRLDGWRSVRERTDR
jgi:hypothetical protein